MLLLLMMMMIMMMMMMMIITTTTIIIIAFKGAVRDFYTVSSLRRELSLTRTLKWPRHNRVKITCNTSRAYHVQHIVCHLVRRDSSANKFDSAFILALLCWLKPLTDDDKKATQLPRELQHCKGLRLSI